MTYRELLGRVDRFARRFLALGLGPGDHVVVWMPNCVEWAVANLALAKVGAVTVTCNSRYKALEVEYLLTPEEVIEFARGRIANFKVPRHAEIVREFPLTGAGKVQKFKQKAAAIETHGFKGPV